MMNHKQNHSQTIQQYIHEFENFLMKTGVYEMEEQTMARFLRVLIQKLLNVDLRPHSSVQELYHITSLIRLKNQVLGQLVHVPTSKQLQKLMLLKINNYI